MWPFSDWVERKLLEPSPYRDEMEALYQESSSSSESAPRSQE